MTRPLIAGLLSLMLLSAAARAVPPDRLLDLRPGEDRFDKAPPGPWQAISLDTGVAEAQYFDTAELFVQARGVGKTQVLLFNRTLGQVLVWGVRVGITEPTRVPARTPDTTPLVMPCGCGAENRLPLTCRIESVECLGALRGFLEGSTLNTADVQFTYTVPVLQALLRDLSAQLQQAGFAGVELSFLGANLSIRGPVGGQAQRLRLLQIIYLGMPGKLFFDRPPLEDARTVAPQGLGW